MKFMMRVFIEGELDNTIDLKTYSLNKSKDAKNRIREAPEKNESEIHGQVNDEDYAFDKSYYEESTEDTIKNNYHIRDNDYFDEEENDIQEENQIRYSEAALRNTLNKDGLVISRACLIS